jgi:hypothetical protein
VTPSELSLARHRLYALLGRLWVEGPQPEVLETARAVPGLAEALAGDTETLAVGHLCATTDVPCAASPVLGEDGLVGGEVAEGVARAYGQAGFLPGRRDVPLDHVGMQLAFVGHLCATGDDARPFLDQHLLRWLPAWAVAVRDADPAWGAVASLSLELAASHRADLGGEVPGSELAGPAVALDPDLGLDEVAAMLVRPARSGWLLGRTALMRACAAAGVAGGLGDRARVLGAALRGAAAVGQLQALVDALVGSADHGDRELSALVEAMPALGPAVSPWRARLAVTRGALTELEHRSVDPSV